MEHASAYTRFLQVPELVLLLMTHLGKREISRFMLTCRTLHSTCISSLYRTLKLNYDLGHKNLLESPAATFMLAKNTRHIQKLECGRLELVYIYLAIQAFDKIEFQATGKAPPPLPPWLPASDVNTFCHLIPLPTMSRLTALAIDLDVGGTAYLLSRCRYYIPICRENTNMAFRISWILQRMGGSHLQDLTLNLLYISSNSELEVLATTIQSLTGLRRLDLGLYTFSAREGRPIGSYLLRYCPPSLELLRVDVGDVQLSLMEEYGFDSDSEDDSNGDSEDGDESESEEEEGGEVLGDDESVTGESEDPEMDGEVYVSNINHLHVEAAVERRTAPLVHLKAFWCWDLLGHSEKEVREIFETCPNIEQLHLPNLSSRLDVDTTMIARAIVESCPKVNTLQFYGQGSDTKIELPFKVLELLPEQQVQQACIRNFHIELDEQMARGVFLRHSTTLHTLILQGCSPTDSAAIRVILAECGALEDLRFIHTNHKDYEAIWPYPDLYGKGCGILLADAVAAPWACTKLKRLELLVRINELCAEPGLVRVAYFRREAPVELTPTETRFFESLERLYRQIGSLVELQHLDLQLDLMSSDGGRHEDIPTSSEVSFPGMLNLDMGRPGYLELLGGLKKLRELRGSVRADTYETTLRMGALEAYWMRDHWPELELAEFFFKGSDITQPFRWLQEQQRQRGRNLKLVVPYSLYEDCVERVWAFPPK